MLEEVLERKRPPVDLWAGPGRLETPRSFPSPWMQVLPTIPTVWSLLQAPSLQTLTCPGPPDGTCDWSPLRPLYRLSCFLPAVGRSALLAWPRRGLVGNLPRLSTRPRRSLEWSASVCVSTSPPPAGPSLQTHSWQTSEDLGRERNHGSNPGRALDLPGRSGDPYVGRPWTSREFGATGNAGLSSELVGIAQGAVSPQEETTAARWAVLLDPDDRLGVEAPLRNWEEELMLEKDLRVLTILLV